MHERIDDPDATEQAASPDRSCRPLPAPLTAKRRSKAEAIGGLEVTELSFESVARLFADEARAPKP